MTCAHVRGLIDAGPFADYPRAHLDAAWRHARGCDTCGAALKAATALTADLAALPQPAAPPELAAAVLARIERIEERRTMLDPATLAAARMPFRPREWSAWVSVSGGLVVVLAIVLAMSPVDRMSMDMTALARAGTMRNLLMIPLTSAWALVLAAGLVLYVIGLFAPFGAGTRRARREV